MRIDLSWLRTLSAIVIMVLACVPVDATEIQLKQDGGVYVLPVNINGVITLDFVLDTGAADVSVPADVVSTLLRAKTINESDFLPGKSYVLADGSVIRSPRFLLRVLNVGGMKVTNVPASVAPVRGTLLLGQSFLQKIDAWKIDNQRGTLILGSGQQQPVWPTIGRVKATIDVPHDGVSVERSVLVTGRIYGLASYAYAFLVIQSAAPEFGKRIYPQESISAGMDGLWYAKGIFATPNYPYLVYIVATDNQESARILARKTSRAFGLTQLPPGTNIISLVITVHRR